MDKKVLQLEVSSPAELQEALANHTQGNGARFAAVRVFGPQVLTRQFNFPKTSPKDLIGGLKLEASEIMSGTADVEMTYQATGTDDQGIHGVYSVMPRQLLMDYLECFKAHQLVPVSLTASAIGAVTDFLKGQALTGDNFCLVNFLNPQAVNIIIFANAKPVFFRELYDMSDSDFKDKITDTIRYSCSQSASKSIDHIFFIGDLTGKEALMKSLKELKNFSTSPPGSATGGPVELTSLNFFRNFVCGLAERRKLVFVFSFIFIVSLLLCILLAWRLNNTNARLQEAKLKLNMSDYNKALDLQEQVRRLNHV